MTMRALFLLIPLLAAGCPFPGPVNPTPIDGATCADVCAHMAELGCPSAQPTPAGVGCEEVCESVQASGIVKWDLGCRAAALTCGEADVCEG